MTDNRTFGGRAIPGTAFQRFMAWKEPFADYRKVQELGIHDKRDFVEACKAVKPDRDHFQSNQDDVASLAANVAHILKIADIARSHGMDVPDLGEPPTS